MRIGYCVHNLNDPAVERRCAMFEAGGAEVALAGFSRDETLRPGIAARRPLQLGRSRDAAFVSRALATMRETAFQRPLRRHLAECDAIVARNLEQLAIMRRLAGSRTLVYECLDIHRTLTGESAAARTVQALEARLLRRCDLLLTSSPAFLRNHFDRRPARPPSMLIENKVLRLDAAPGPATVRRPPDTRPVTIGWFGMLRCWRSLDFLSRLAARSEGRIAIRIAGKPSLAELPDFERRVAAMDGVDYLGPYAADDLRRLYGECHFAWTIDWFEEGLNSSWLLPNRLYESIAMGAVPIALADIEIGRWLANHRAGMRVVSADEAGERLLAISSDEIAAMQRDVAAIDRAAVFCDRAECAALVERIGAAASGSSRR